MIKGGVRERAYMKRRVYLLSGRRNGKEGLRRQETSVEKYLKAPRV